MLNLGFSFQFLAIDGRRNRKPEFIVMDEFVYLKRITQTVWIFMLFSVCLFVSAQEAKQTKYVHDHNN